MLPSIAVSFRQMHIVLCFAKKAKKDWKNGSILLK